MQSDLPHLRAEDEPAPERHGLVLGLDIGGSKTALMASDVATGDDLGFDRFPTAADAGPEAMIAEFLAAARNLIRKTDHDVAELRAVGIAVPGQVEFESGRVINAGNLAGWRDLPLRDIVSRELNVPVFVEQDANAAALGERWRGSAKLLNNFVFLAIGTGIGAGVVVNGRLHRGFHNAAGELGNVLMGRQFLGRDRGGHGNLEALIGGRNIRRTAELIASRDLSAAEALALGETDHRFAPLLERTVDYLSMAIVAIAATLDPEAIILGGGTAAAGDVLISTVRDRLSRELPVHPALIHAVLGEDAQLHGAVFGALWELDPELALREELR